MVVNSMKKDNNNNDQLNHLKKLHTLNSEHFTHRDHQDVKKQFEKVKEVIDPTGNVSIFSSTLLFHIFFYSRPYSNLVTKHRTFLIYKSNIFQKLLRLSI